MNKEEYMQWREWWMKWSLVESFLGSFLFPIGVCLAIIFSRFALFFFFGGYFSSMALLLISPTTRFRNFNDAVEYKDRILSSYSENLKAYYDFKKRSFRLRITAIPFVYPIWQLLHWSDRMKSEQEFRKAIEAYSE